MAASRANSSSGALSTGGATSSSGAGITPGAATTSGARSTAGATATSGAGSTDGAIAADRPIDVVIAWVDGSDPKLAEKRNRYSGKTAVPVSSGAHPTRFASSNEIRYCVLSVLKFAPFVRNIFIVTDGQDPGISGDVSKYFPGRSGSIRIVDHTEIFDGYGDTLPTFNSISIANMIWRIRGLADSFVYFNDDTFLVRNITPEEWFIDGRPVMRGKWVPAARPRVVLDRMRKWFNMHLAGKPDNQPRASFHVGQWNAAALLGYRFRYFTNSHTPHPVGRSLVEDFFRKNDSLLRKNISYRFRDHSQFTFISLSNHLQLIDGNRNIARPAVVYLKPENRGPGYIDKKISLCEGDPEIIYMCAQSLDMVEEEERMKLFSWLDRILGL